MHCSIIASRLLGWPLFLAASAVPACNARAATESAVTSSAERVLVLSIFLSSLRCDCLDHERVRSPRMLSRDPICGGQWRAPPRGARLARLRRAPVCACGGGGRALCPP